MNLFLSSPVLRVSALILGLGLAGCASGASASGNDPALEEENDAGAGGEAGEGGAGGGAGKGGSPQAGAGGAGKGGSAGGGVAGSGGSTAGSGGSAAGSGGSAAGSGGSTAGSGGAGVVCGDGKKEDKEACDSGDFGGTTCASLLGAGYGGNLKCTAGCKIDSSGCAKNPTCGDSAVNATGEECDGGDFNSQTCAKFLSMPGATGVLKCTAGCKIDSSGCKLGPFCGDGVKNNSEACDGSDIGTSKCADATGNPEMGGILGCKADCTFDTAKCVLNPKCGDGAKNNVGEQCDGADLDGATCKSLLNPQASGSLKCSPECKFDTSGCVVPAFCGDGTRNSGEECDGNDLAGETCASKLGQGNDGPLVCTPTCTISTAQCVKVPFCGDGQKNGTEQCEGAVGAGDTCAAIVGPTSTGTVACKADCTFDLSGCSVPISCGNGAVDADKGEQCDGGNFNGSSCATVLGNPKATGNLVCTATCTLDSSACTIPPYCGDGKLAAGEECDDGNNTADDGCGADCKVQCFPGEKKLGTHCYADSTGYNDDSYSWDEAEARCASGGGHLVSITSQAEFDFVLYDVMPGGLFDPTSPRWIGFNDKTTEGVFVWSSGEPTAAVAWSSGEPNNAGGNEDCADMAWLDGSWNDNNCSSSKLYICEYPPVVLFP